MGIPPLVFRSIIGLFLAFFIIRALEIFDWECARQIEIMEQQQILAAERQRIGRDLHDGAIQSAYTAGLLVESASRLAEPESEIKHRLDRAVTAMNSAIADMRRNLDDLQSTPTSLPLKSSLEDLIEDPHYNSLLEVHSRFELQDCQSLTSLRIDHVLSITKEALANVVRHANAQKVWINAYDREDRLWIVVKDDGDGIAQPIVEGYGIRNMRDRARLLGGNLAFESSVTGTAVTLNIPWEDEP